MCAVVVVIHSDSVNVLCRWLWNISLLVLCMNISSIAHELEPTALDDAVRLSSSNQEIGRRPFHDKICPIVFWQGMMRGGRFWLVETT